MGKIHGITHDKKLTEAKVNYFLDYFYFYVDQVGKYDGFDMENYISLSEKIIFQIEHNTKRPHEYIERYLTHPLFDKDFPHFKQFRNYKKIIALKDNLQSLSKSQKKKDYVLNEAFLKTIVNFRNLVKKKLFKAALKDIISYLKCIHQLNEHQEDLIYCTKVIATCLLNEKNSKEDVLKVTRRIFSKELYDFPFPKNIDQNDDTAKKEYLTNSDFDKQFNAIYNVLTERYDNHWFLFRINEIEAPQDFIFTYNKVTFLHPNNSKFDSVKENLNNKKFGENYFDKKNILIAIVRIGHSSSQKVKSEAIKIIEGELLYLNNVLDSQATIDKRSNLITQDFINTGGQIQVYDPSYRVRKYDIDNLNDNPYKFLKGGGKIRKHLLKTEPLFIKAINSENASDYWQYLETMFHNNKNSSDNNQVVNLVSSILLLNAESTQKRFLKAYLAESFSHFQTSAEQLGITSDRQYEIEKMFYAKEVINFSEIKSEINHPFVQFLISEHNKPFNLNEFMVAQKFYQHILWDAQAERNSYLHSGLIEENSKNSLNFLLPRLIMKLRWILFAEIKKNKDLSFSEFILVLKKQSDELLQKIQ